MTVDVSGWAPRWLPAREQVERQAASLHAVLGNVIVDAWLVWDLEHDEWFADLPVVLRFDDGRQLEVCWQKFDDLSVTWNTIDTDTHPHAWVEWPLEWRAGAHQALESNIGSALRGVFLTEHLFTTQRVDHPEPPSSVWLASGLWFETTGPGLHVFNALDENGLSVDAPTQDKGHRFARTSV